ncbi:hypothetical protein PI124_g8870 [Phytophthora idaei]|nr:hypothetical protein PI125_g12415 [Phytophthora idaei]KAG3158132.1 hypothetical protein PI126_g7995 [Phytophthora idaei]KAG3246404.1 hypothetical protein PI124_g8870 [Phytophthora idaei]
MSDDTSEERAMPGAAKLHNLANSGAQNLKNLASSAKQKLLSNNQKATDKLFARLEAYKKNPGMGRSAMFSSMSMFSTLIAHYGDERWPGF